MLDFAIRKWVAALQLAARETDSNQRATPCGQFSERHGKPQTHEDRNHRADFAWQ